MQPPASTTKALRNLPALRCLRWLFSGCFALSLLLVAGHFSPVQAANKPSRLAKRRQAKRLFNQARLAYRAGDYEEAILKWQESFRISQHPLIYTSIANAYERLGKYKEALDALRIYRKSAPRREHATLDARIDSLQERVERQERADERRRKERLKQEEALSRSKQARAAEKKKRLEDERSAREAKTKIWRWVGWPMAGTGAALVVTGISMGAVAASRRVDSNAACKTAGNSTLCSSDSADDIQSSNRLATVGDALWISGTVLALGGASFLFFGLRGDDDQENGVDSNREAKSGRIQLSPYAGPRGGGLVVVGQF